MGWAFVVISAGILGKVLLPITDPSIATEQLNPSSIFKQVSSSLEF
jgi:hypothetical protein